MPVTNNDNKLINLESNMTRLALMGKSIVNWNKLDLYSLFLLHAQARGELVERVDDADTIFSVDYGVTPFDMDKIISEFI